MTQKPILPIKHFYMIRHGETEANAAKIMAGSIDTPLTQRGIAQAQGVREIVKTLEIKPTKIIHSHLSRARDTARIINESLMIPMHEDPDYAEMHAGDWEGVTYAKCRTLLSGWQNPPNGETHDTFQERIKTAKNRALQSSDPVMIVCHGGVFRAFLRLHNIESYGVQNCKLYEFTPKNDPQMSHFPWDVWRYDFSDTVIRKSVCLESDPTSEIA